MTAERLELLLTGAVAVTGDPEQPLIDDALIGIRGSRIATIGPARRDAPLPAADRVIALDDHLVVPGFVNVHTHAILTMVRGVAEDMGFAPAYTPGVPHGHEVTEEEAVALARLGALEALLFGSTLINDSYVHADLTLPAMADVGLRVYACGRIHDVDFSRVHLGEWEHKDAIGDSTLAAAIELQRKWHGQRNGRVGVQLTPHAPDTCSRRLLQQISDYAARHRLPVATHLSQSRLENRRIEEREGCSPTQLLQDVGLLNDRLLAAHGMYLSDDDIERAGRARINLAHIPKGNATGGRIAPTRALRSAGANLCLGTDNMHADMIEVMRWALCMARIQSGAIDEEWQPRHVLEMATINGARAMGLEHEIGSLQPGKRADIVCIDTRRPHLVPRINLLGNLVHTGQGRDVSMVFVDGEVVVEDGRPTRVDSQQILDDAQAAAAALWDRARKQA
ncbi:MAG TPA: amidohydrolase family protein [Burkholderiaceae bacterium]|nr:amidohydrolase family protein [Burkholderiaceae bacterium]